MVPNTASNFKLAKRVRSRAKKNNTRQIHKIIIEEGTLALMLHANPPFLAPNFRLSKDDF